VTSLEEPHHLVKLGFDPSLHEQLLLPKVQNHNLLLVYSTDESLIRIQSLLILFYLNQSSGHKPPRILILTKKSTQQKFQSLLKSHLAQLTTVLNGSILPNARKLDYNRYSVIFSTPRTAKNDLVEEFFPPNHFSLIMVNQAEMGSSSSSLRYLVKKLTDFRMIGFTKETPSELLDRICKNLKLTEVVQLEEPFSSLERSNIQHYSIPLPQEYFFVLEILDQIKEHELEELAKLGFDVTSKSNYRDITAIHESIKEDKNSKLFIRTANLLRIMAIQKIIISQGFPATFNYFSTLESQLEKVKKFQGKQSIIEFLSDMKIIKLQEFLEVHKDLQHPKSNILLKIISQYKSGISIITHNYYNASFLKDYLILQDFSVIQIKEPISSLTEIKLKRAILPFTEKKVNICITNTVNEIIARNAEVIIAYDVNADIVDTLNSLVIDIPKVFLLAKQTNEEARFFYLKRLGSQPQTQISNFKVLNENLAKSKGAKSIIEQRNDPQSSTSPSDDDLLGSNFSLVFNNSLFELGIPYLFPQKEYSIKSNHDCFFPGFILDQRTCFLILVPDTIEFFLSSKPQHLFDKLIKEFSQVHLILFPHSLATLSFEFRCNILHAANRQNIWISFLTQDQDIPKLVRRVIDKPMFKFSLTSSEVPFHSGGG
jgi:hypothetical protein